ncbi:hypothetical protein, partial [Streptomyces decoyicus]|uniref:hypothetical protein n=1 Tax=Streptomyces decoyicus TaxID=249567 RepID=UPI00339EFD86
AGVQMEYVRRISWPSTDLRSAMCCPGVCRKVEGLEPVEVLQAEPGGPVHLFELCLHVPGCRRT